MKTFLRTHLNKKTKDKLKKFRAIILKPTPKELLQLADRAYKNKNWKDAISSYTKIIDENANTETFARLAIAQRFIKDYEGSEETLKLGLKQFPDNTALLIEYAALANNRGNWEEAVELWEKCKKQSKKFSELNYSRYTKAYLKSKEELLFKDSLLLEAEIKSLCKDKKLELSLLVNIKNRVIEIRNVEQNKLLAIKLIENSCRIFIHNKLLYNELIVSYIDIGDLQQAILVFESIFYDFHTSFDSHDHSQLARYHQMVNTSDDYGSMLLDMIRENPIDQDVHIRYIYASFLNYYKKSQFDDALRKINLLLATNKLNFWSMSREQLLTYRNECIKKMNIKNIKPASSEISIIANRADGLGERLNAMLNAIVIAKTFGYTFGYTWKSETHANHLQKDAEKNPNLVGHSVVPENNFFAESFISTYSLDNNNNMNFKVITGKDNTYSSLYQSEIKNRLDGWISPRLELKEHFHEELLIDNTFSYKDAFLFLKFTDPISYSINLAKRIMNNDTYIALHLRSGDVFYGEYRKFVHYSYKGIVLPLAKAIIEQYLKKDFKVVVFGQDLQVLKYLKNTYKITTVEDFQEYHTFDTTQKAMFEIILMSEAESIIAGSSGFAKLASWIGAKNLKTPGNFYTASEQTSLIKKDLANNEDIYSKLQTSFAYWYAYYYGRHGKTLNEIQYFLKKAYSFDPKNELYPIILASMYYKFKEYDEAEMILNKLFGLHEIFDLKKHPAIQVLTAKTMGKLNILEYIKYFEETASEKNPYASLVMYSIEPDNLKSKKYFDFINKNKNKNNWLECFCSNQHILWEK